MCGGGGGVGWGVCVYWVGYMLEIATAIKNIYVFQKHSCRRIKLSCFFQNIQLMSVVGRKTHEQAKCGKLTM